MSGEMDILQDSYDGLISDEERDAQLAALAEEESMTALPLEPHTEAEEATLARFEGAEPAEESAVEKVARAIRGAEEAHGPFYFPCQCGWEAGFGVGWEERGDRHQLLSLAAAAIEAMKGPSPAEEALARVEALAEEHEEWARINGDLAYRFSAQGDLVTEQYHLGLKQAQEVSADRIRAAIAAPVAQAGEGR